MNKVGQYGRSCTEHILQEAMPAHELFIAAGSNKNHARIAIVLND
jgi:hypothetical protein